MTSWPALFVSVALAFSGSACGKGDGDKSAAEAKPGEPGKSDTGAKTTEPSAAGKVDVKPPGPVPQKDGADGLKAWMETSIANCLSKSFAAGKAQTVSAIPTREHLLKLFKDGIDQAIVDAIVKLYAELPPEDETVACWFTPKDGRREVKVAAATTEELAAFKEGTVAYAKFPSGAKDVAEKALRPGTTMYEVDVTEPGAESGMKYHLFFWDGAQWRMLGAVWRAFRP